MKQTEHTGKRRTHLPEQVFAIAETLKDRGIDTDAEAAVILGSGLGGFTNAISDPLTIPYHELPHFPRSSVAGHKGELIFGMVSGIKTLAFSGRFHHYEGYTFEQTALPVYLASALQVDKLIISNAAGGINTQFQVGDLMVIDSVIRTIGPTSPFSFQTFRFNLGEQTSTVREVAAKLGLVTQQGTYIFVPGPNYESKAEIRAFRTIGADAVGMSTVPELTEASRLGLKSVAISLISNMAAGVTGQKLDHNEVKKAADNRKDDFTRLVAALIEDL